MTKRKYWYKLFIGECPVCGRDASYRVRVYGKKPKYPKKRYILLDDKFTYCGCIR